METLEAQTQDTLVTLDTLETLEIADHQCVELNHAKPSQPLVTTPPEITPPDTESKPIVSFIKKYF